MKDTEKKLLEKTAQSVYVALISQWKGSGKPPLSELAVEAWRAAIEFVKVKELNEANEYLSILHNYKGMDALRRIMVKDGIAAGRFLDFLINQYKDEADPLMAYASENHFNKNYPGKTAIKEFMKNKAAA
jgi:hypothetical protein